PAASGSPAASREALRPAVPRAGAMRFDGAPRAPAVPATGRPAAELEASKRPWTRTPAEREVNFWSTFLRSALRPDGPCDRGSPRRLLAPTGTDSLGRMDHRMGTA